MLRFLLLYNVICTDNELEDFLNKPIKIFFAGYGSTFLGLDTETNELVARNKYTDFKKHNFDPSGKIIKNGTKFEIYYRGKKMCAKGKLISECETNGGWSLTRTNFGYTINTGGKCITKDSADTVRMKKCSETDDQIFSLKTVSSADDCGVQKGLDTTDSHNVNVNIGPMLENTSKSLKVEPVRILKKIKPVKEHVIHAIPAKEKAFGHEDFEPTSYESI